MLAACTATLSKPMCKTENAWPLDRGQAARTGSVQQTLTCVPLVLQLHPQLLVQIPVGSPLVTFADHNGKGRRLSF